MKFATSCLQLTHLTWLVNLHYRVTVKHSLLPYKRVVKLCLHLHWWSEFVWVEWAKKSREQSRAVSRSRKNERSGAERRVGGRRAGAEHWAEISEMRFNVEQPNSPLSASPVISPMLCSQVPGLMCLIRMLPSRLLMIEWMSETAHNKPGLSMNSTCDWWINGQVHFCL